MSPKFFKRFTAPGLLALALLGVVLLAAIGGGGSEVQANDGNRDIERAIAAQERHNAELFSIDGVVGTGVGHGPGGAAAVIVLTETSGVTGIPGALDGVQVVTQVTGRIVALHCRGPHEGQDGCDDHSGGGGGNGGGNGGPPGNGEDVDPKATFDRPVPIGVSSGSERLIDINGGQFCTVGTLGARVSDGADVYALSNAHVYAHEGSTPVGNVVTGVNGDRILQAGRVDLPTGCGTDAEIDAAVIGTLHAFVPIQFDPDLGDDDPGPDNTVDAAIALSSTAVLGNATPSDGYGIPNVKTATARVNQSVKKYGRTTGETKGFVFMINAIVDVNYDTGVARFVNQIAFVGDPFVTFSALGDSGSLIVTKGGSKPLALLFAGGGGLTFGNPIDAVLDAFNVTIDGE